MLLQATKMSELPDGFEALARIAAAEGHGFLLKMLEEWRNGKNRFQRTGEVFFALMTPQGELAGVGGLNIDPYTDHQEIGRIRHVYIAPAFRKTGAGRILLEHLIAHSKGTFSVLRLKTHNPSAVKFYERFGFKVDRSIEDSRHTYMLTPLAP